jgi:hypothetical protein
LHNYVRALANTDMAAASNIHLLAALDSGQMMNAQPVSDSMRVEQIFHSYQTFLLPHPISEEPYPLTWAPGSIVSTLFATWVRIRLCSITAPSPWQTLVSFSWMFATCPSSCILAHDHSLYLSSVQPGSAASMSTVRDCFQILTKHC